MHDGKQFFWMPEISACENTLQHRWPLHEGVVPPLGKILGGCCIQLFGTDKWRLARIGAIDELPQLRPIALGLGTRYCVEDSVLFVFAAGVDSLVPKNFVAKAPSEVFRRTHVGRRDSDGRSAREINCTDGACFVFAESSIKQLLLLVYHPKPQALHGERVFLGKRGDLLLYLCNGQARARRKLLRFAFPELRLIVSGNELQAAGTIGEACAYPIHDRNPFSPRQRFWTILDLGKKLPAAFRLVEDFLRPLVQGRPDLFGAVTLRQIRIPRIHLGPDIGKGKLLPGTDQLSEEFSLFCSGKGVGAKVSKSFLSKGSSERGRLIVGGNGQRYSLSARKIGSPENSHSRGCESFIPKCSCLAVP
jgi:hypothetical protein